MVNAIIHIMRNYIKEKVWCLSNGSDFISFHCKNDYSVFSIKIINIIALDSSIHFMELTSSTNTGISTVNVNISYKLDERIKRKKKHRKNHLQFDIVFVATLILLFCLMAEASENSTREEKKQCRAVTTRHYTHFKRFSITLCSRWCADHTTCETGILCAFTVFMPANIFFSAYEMLMLRCEWFSCIVVCALSMHNKYYPQAEFSVERCIYIYIYMFCCVCFFYSLIFFSFVFFRIVCLAFSTPPSYMPRSSFSHTVSYFPHNPYALTVFFAVIRKTLHKIELLSEHLSLFGTNKKMKTRRWKKATTKKCAH